MTFPANGARTSIANITHCYDMSEYRGSVVNDTNTNHSISQQEHQTDNHDELVHRLCACGILLHEEVYRHRKHDYVYACVILVVHSRTERYGSRTVHHHSDEDSEDCVERK